MSSSGAASRLAIVLLSVAAFASAANMRVIDPLLVQLSADFGGAVGDWLGWRAVFWVLAVIYISAGVALVAVIRVRPDLAAPGERASGSMLAQMLAVLKRRWARTVILVVALEGGVFWGAFTFV